MIRQAHVRARPSARALTLLEVMVAAAILVGMVLVLATAILSMTRAAKASHSGLDMDRDARRIMMELRRELRQSGRLVSGEMMIAARASGDGVALPADLVGEIAHVNSGATAGADMILLTYRNRTGLGDDVDVTAAPPAASDPNGNYDNWGPPVALRAVHQGTFAGTPNTMQRYRLVRWPQQAVLAEDVSYARAEVLLDGLAVKVTLELTRPARDWTGSTAPAPLTRVYEEIIEILNKAEAD